MSRPYSPTEPSLPEPTAAQQRVLDRIATQRERIAARRAQRLQALAAASAAPEQALDGLLVQRLATFTQQHPVAVAALVGSVLAAGPKRLVRWAGILLPLVVRLRSR